MGKINLAKQNQYVEFAEKDDEGNSISQTFKTIEEAIDGKIGFNGIVTVEMIGGYRGIKKAKLPTTAGVYKLSSGGILCITVNSESSISLIATYGDNMYTETRDPASTADFKFIEDNRMGDKPIYYHGLNMFSSDTKKSFQCVVFNNSPELINTVAKFRAWAESISGTVLFNGNGCISVGDTYYPVHVIIKSLGNTYELYYITPSGGSTMVTSANLNDIFASVQDYCNRIN